MRIVSGLRRGMSLTGPRDNATRPTSDRARQVIFDILAHAPWANAHRIKGARLLDAFAGTGALGLEGLSRGASSCHFMEVDAAARRILAENVARLETIGTSTIIKCDTTLPPKASIACDVAFLDPPYGHGLIAKALPALLKAGWINAETLVVTESESAAGTLRETSPYDARKIGVAHVAFWKGADWLTI